MKQYLFAIITILLLMLFYLGIPDPDKTRITPGDSKIGRIDIISIVSITVIFAFVDFWGLGDRHDPETFTMISENNAFITVEQDTLINKLVLYTGVGSGNYIIDYSEDGVIWDQAADFSQDSSSILKWNYVIPSSGIEHPKYIRIYASGNAYLGELFLLDEDGNAIPYSSSNPAINDEQNELRDEQTYMNSSYFDEIYHARTAWEHLNNVYPYEVSHPPLGKLLIAVGISIFGMNPFGWRFIGTLTGVLMLPVLYVFSKKMFGSLRVSICTTLLFAFDFMHFVQTRIATIDSYAVFFILLMYLCMYEYITKDKLKFLALSGIFFGIGAACKWTCIYAGAGLAVIWLIYRISKLKEGVSSLLKNIAFCLVFFIFIPSLIYCLSYIPYALAQGVTPVFSLNFYDLIIQNQKFMFSYHSNLVAEHPYSSLWYQWVFDIRPILYYLKYNPDATRQSFGAFVNPVICWGGLVALFVLLYYAIFKKDNKASFILIGYASQLLPWVFVKRLTFEYHYFPSVVFLILALGYVFKLMEPGTKNSRIYIYSFTALSAVLFVMFYPVLSGIPIKESVQKAFLSWLPTWPF